jgi:arylsulfate sulfotransferase
MKTSRIRLSCLIGLGAFCAPGFATVSVSTLTPSLKSPEVIGTVITWTARATDSNTNPLTFQFTITPPNGPALMVRDFNVGTETSGVWAGHLPWTPTGVEGVYSITVVAKDFTSGESATKTTKFQVTPLVNGSSPVVANTANPIVVLFSAPSCAVGSSMRVSFQPQSGSVPAVTTNWTACHPPRSMTFEIAGMYPSTAYNIFAQTQTGSNIVNGATVVHTTGALPPKLPFPAVTQAVAPGPNTDTTDWMMLLNSLQLGNGINFPEVATDQAGKIIWYYYPPDDNHTALLTRPLQNGYFLSIQSGPAWNPKTNQGQLLLKVDLAGNAVQETNIGAVAAQLFAMGATDAEQCFNIQSPAPIGSACVGAFHHDAIQSLPNGDTAVLADIEKIFPPGAQGDTSGLPVDIIGDMIVVLDQNWQVKWYFDTFQHDQGAPQLDINRGAVLGETCGAGQGGCPPTLLLGPGIKDKANDWLHANSLYYWPTDGSIVFSSRHQDWVMKVNYANGTGNGDILWRMGREGDFTYNNITNDPWPWFSHQHEAGVENNGTGVMTIFDNGNTRISAKPLGLGAKCGPSDCHSRGIALNVNETNMQVTPVMSQDLGYYSNAMGSAQLLDDGNYYYLPAMVVVSLHNAASYATELFPTAGTDNGTTVLQLKGPSSYRGWQLPNLYNPPTT